MGWNYRVLANKYKDEIFFDIHEVYYSKNNKPNGYTENPVSVGGDSLKSIKHTLKKMKESLKKPILWGEDKFPSKYNG